MYIDLIALSVSHRGIFLTHKCFTMNWRILILVVLSVSTGTAQSVCDPDSTPPDLKLYAGTATVALDADSAIIIYAKDLDAGTTDNCTPSTNLIFSFSENPQDVMRTITCADAGLTTMTIYAYDASGNKTSGTVILLITGTLCPQVIDEFDVSINLMNFKSSYRTVVGSPLIKLTAGNGADTSSIPNSYYSRQPAGSGIYLKFTPEFYSDYAGRSVRVALIDSDPDIINGVSTLDVLAIRKHILGIQKFSNAYYAEAADINGDGKITAIDIIELRRVVLGIQDSWRYVPNWHYEFLSEPVFLVDELHQKTLNCIAVKTGDVN